MRYKNSGCTLLGAEFTVYTDHKPLKSLFTMEMANTKIQHWACVIGGVWGEDRIPPGEKQHPG